MLSDSSDVSSISAIPAEPPEEPLTHFLHSRRFSCRNGTCAHRPPPLNGVCAPLPPRSPAQQIIRSASAPSAGRSSIVSDRPAGSAPIGAVFVHGDGVVDASLQVRWTASICFDSWTICVSRSSRPSFGRGLTRASNTERCCAYLLRSESMPSSSATRTRDFASARPCRMGRALRAEHPSTQCR